MQPSQDPSLDPIEPTARYINREISWLDFNERVLALAEDPERPLLERVKFLAIFARNLDEFFQIRVSGLLEQRDAGIVAMAEGLTPEQQLAEIRNRVERQQVLVHSLFEKELRPALDKAGIRLVDWDELGSEDRAGLEAEFGQRIFPVLTPLAVDPAHPFPYISDLSLNLAALVRDPMTGLRRFARVKVPPLLPRFLALDDGERSVPLEQVIAAHLDRLFPGMEIVERDVFRVTRDADLEVEEDEGEDLLAAIESVLSRRRRGATSVRLEIHSTMSEEISALLIRELDLDPDQVYVAEGLLDLGSLWSYAEMDRPDLRDDAWSPVTPTRLVAGEGGPADLFTVLQGGDLLVHHPYDSFSTTVEAFVEEAAADPDVLAIKQTLYRTSAHSPIVRALISAAESGKQVVALVELKARFDELANITWARTLEQAGVHVVYGVVGLKTHVKVSLAVRREGNRIRRYAHVGTGNYNPTTAKIYEDIGLLTADQELAADVSDLFNLLTGYSRQRSYGKLLVAPSALRLALVKLIRAEARSGDGEIVMKLNSMTDAEMIDELYAASEAGTKIDLDIRGTCCLRPGVPGLSERIRVRSIVGRFLEHSRIFRFGSLARGRRHYIGSADLMGRNLDRRVEALAPVEDPSLQARLDEILDVGFSDDVLAWELGPAGEWAKVPTVRGADTHDTLMRFAVERARGLR